MVNLCAICFAWPRLFETPRALPQPRLFVLDALGKGGWLKAR